MELTYTRQGDYLIPNLMPPEAPRLGKYGMMRRTYLRQNRNGLYTGMMLAGKLDQHLMDIDSQANSMMDRLTKQMAQAEGVTEALKASNQMEWVRRKNSIHSRAEEIVKNQLICS